MKLYHGTFSEIKSFWPSSHFGEEMQAIIAVGLHRFADEDPIFQNGEPRLYECEINIKEEEIMDVVDWGAPNPQANFRSFAYGIKKGEMFLELWREIPEDTYDGRWLARLQHETSSIGIFAMRYINEVEKLLNIKSPSLMVIDPNRIEIVKCRKLSWDEVLSALKQFDSTNYHSDWNEIMAKAHYQANIAR